MKRKFVSRFPMARLKKMMLEDEEIGKVAGATPLLISKCVELFVGDLVDSAKAETDERGSKIMQPYHLRASIMTEDNFDFLRGMVENVADPGTEESEPKPKKRAKKAKKEVEAKAEDKPEPVPGDPVVTAAPFVAVAPIEGGDPPAALIDEDYDI